MTDTPSEQPSADQRSEQQQARQAAWNRVGQYLESAAALGQTMSARNFELWKAVARDLTEDPYSADTLATSTGRVVIAAQQTFEDVWAALSTPPDTRASAQQLPTTFLYYDLREATTKAPLQSPVYIRVPSGHADVPPTARFALSGTAAPGAGAGSAPGADPTQDGVAALYDRLQARLTDDKQAYLLSTVEPPNATTRLVPGVYEGMIFVANPALALASIRVVIDGPSTA